MLLNAPPPASVRAALLVDADNVPPALVEFALQQLERRGCTVPLRRAYGGHEKLLGLKTVIQRHALRAFVNQGKGTTDVALVVDAMDLLHASALPPTVAIVSSDHDFAPLALRLRESGHRVWCFAHQVQACVDDLACVYDEVICMPLAAAPEKSLSIAEPTKKFIPKPATPAPLLSTAAKQVVALPDEVARILKAVPELREAPQQLAQVVPVLRQKTIFGKTTKATAFFARYPAYFKLTPAHQPTQLVYIQHGTAPPTVAPVAANYGPTVVPVPTPVPAQLPWKVPVVLDQLFVPLLLEELYGLRSVLLQLALRRLTVADVLLAAPELIRGQPMDLVSVSKKLCSKGILVSPAHGLAVLRAYPLSFRLLPSDLPNAVQYLG